MKPIVALSLFNGISGLHLALDRAEIPIKQIYYSEIDKFANKVTEHHYPNDIALGDVTKWKEWNIDWSSIDIVSAGFPCFGAYEKVLTDKGYVSIKDIQIGDLVYTHTNSWKKVINTFSKVNTIWNVKAQGVLSTETTEEHPYYTTKAKRVNGVRVFSEPSWVEVKNLTKEHFLCLPKITKEHNPLDLTLDECYVIGRYIADGHTTKHKRSEKGRENSRYWNIVLSVGSHKIPKIDIKHHVYQHTQSTHRIVICNKRLVQIVEEHCGNGAMNKMISPTLLELPKEHLKELLRGLLDGDGSVKDHNYSLTTVSENLAMSLNLAVMKAYSTVGNITKTVRPKTTIIQGRVVNQNDTYTLRFTQQPRKQKHYYEGENHFYVKVKSVEKSNVVNDVYNIEVEGDNSYVVNNAVVHNCQAWSVAGKQLGDKDERGMLFWTTLDIIKKVLLHNPNAKFMLENVKMKKEFEQYITHHTEQALGYVEKILINSALVSAQNRNRYYWTNFKVQELPKDKGILLKDILETDVDEKYFYSEKALSYLDRTKINKRFSMFKDNLKSVCVTANFHKSLPYNVYVDRLKSNCILTNYGNMACVNYNKSQGQIVFHNDSVRRLTPLECEHLQTLPDNFTSMLSDTQRYKCIGNGWTTDVISHILRYAFDDEGTANSEQLE